MKHLVVREGAAGRTGVTLAIPPRKVAPLQPAKADLGRKPEAAIACREGESVTSDAASSLTTKIVRATTKFEVRIQPTEEGKVLLTALDDVARMVATAKNAIVRAHWRRDGQWVDDFLTEHARMPMTSELAWERKLYSYARVREVTGWRLNTNVCASVAKDLDSKWGAIRWQVLVAQTLAPPQFKPHQPIPIPSASTRVTDNDDGSMTITFRLYSTEVEGAGRVAIRIVPRDDRQRAELRAIAAGEWKIGQVIVSRDYEKRGRWFIRISHTRFVDVAPGEGVVVARRGMAGFLLAASSDGDVRTVVDGGDLVSFKRQMDARKRSLGRYTKSASGGAVGHGVKRRVGAMISLSDTEARFSKTKCQTSAAALVAYARSRGASEVVVEDFTAPKREGAFWLIKKWPWYMLKEATKSAVEAAGMRFREVNIDGNKLRCPMCSHEHDAVPADSYGRWECAACGQRRRVDDVVLLNMLRDVGAGEGVVKAETKRKAAKLATADARRVQRGGKPAEKRPGADVPR